jgi:hypothetical protein
VACVVSGSNVALPFQIARQPTWDTLRISLRTERVYLKYHEAAMWFVEVVINSAGLVKVTTHI